MERINDRSRNEPFSQGPCPRRRPGTNPAKRFGPGEEAQRNKQALPGGEGERCAACADDGAIRHLQEVNNMKVRPSVKPMCEKCKIIKRKGKVMVICENPKHKQRQG